MPQHSIEIVHKGSPEIRTVVDKTASLATELSEAVPANSTDLALTLNVDISELKMLYIHSDKTLKLETNDAATPADTINLVADEPLVWWVGCGHANPLTADVTAIYATELAGVVANLTIRVLEDATP